MWAIWGDVSPHCKSDNGEIWREGTDLGLLPRAYFVKIAKNREISNF